MKYSFVIAALLVTTSHAVHITGPIKDIPKNLEHEPAMSSTTNPYNYESGSGK